MGLKDMQQKKINCIEQFGENVGEKNIAKVQFS